MPASRTCRTVVSSWGALDYAVGPDSTSNNKLHSDSPSCRRGVVTSSALAFNETGSKRKTLGYQARKSTEEKLGTSEIHWAAIRRSDGLSLTPEKCGSRLGTFVPFSSAAVGNSPTSTAVENPNGRGKPDRALRTNTAKVRGLAAITFFGCVALSGCVGATPLPKRTRTAQGAVVKTVDVSFIQPGKTTRAEVRQKLKLIDTGYEGDRFFLGRWSSSTWGGWIILAGMCCEAIGTGGRVWKSGNLLVEFDEAGLVKRTEPFDDKKANPVLAFVAENTRVPLEPPLEIPLRYLKNNARFVPATIVLSNDHLGLEETSNEKKRYKFSIPAKALVKIQTSIFLVSNDPTYVGWRIHCEDDLRPFGGPRGKDLNVTVRVPQLIMLMSYLQNTSHGGNAEATPDRK